MRILRPFAVLISLLSFLLCPFSFAQIPPTSDTTSTPIHGSGHNYLGDLVETVNPANGSISIRVATMVPPGRGLTLPFTFAYDSNGATYLGVQSDRPFGWLSASAVTSKGGWSNTVPIISTGQTGYTVPGVNIISPPPSQSCAALIDYVFQDSTGSRHDLNLSVFGQSGTNHGGDCAQGGMQWVSTGGEGPILATTSSQPVNAGHNPVTILPVTITDADGTIYNFPGSAPVPSLLPISVTDRNGNTIRVNLTGSNQAYSFVDTLGRAVLSDSGFAVNPETVTVSGLANPYSLSWTNIPAPTFTTSFTNFGPDQCPAPAHFSATVLSSITLPNGKVFSFSYDSAYGMVNRISYPTGAYVRYVWGMNLQSESGSFNFPQATQPPLGCAAHYDTPAIVDRYVSFDGVSEVLHQHFSYSTSWNATQNNHWDSKQTVITTSDLVTGVSYQTVYSYSSLVAPRGPNSPTNAWLTYEIPVERAIQYQSPAGAVLRTVTKSWYSPRSLQAVQTTLDNNQSSLIVYCYNTNEQLIESDAFDFGATAPAIPSCAASNVPAGAQAGPLLRKTTTSYASFTQHIIDRPSAVITYNGSGARLAETDSPSYDANGNVLTQTRQCFLSGGQACPQGNSTSTFTYDSQGQMLTNVDARNSTTTYSYTDNYSSCGGAAPPSSPSDAYVTQITYAQTNGVNHIVKYCYDYSKGLPLSTTDENSRTTTYSYADSFNRLTNTSYPDTGQTTISYNDVSPSPSATTTKLITNGPPSVSLTTIAISDGLGHVTQTQLPTDPDGTTYVAIAYDGLGRTRLSYNPTRCNPPTTNCNESTWGFVTSSFDSLGRTTQVTEQDGQIVTLSYSGNCTTVTDEAGKARKSCVDGLGRLTQVLEDPGSSPHLNYETDYAYDALDNLLSVTQKGGITDSSQWRVRTFAYDSLSRLTSATNPESGTVTYVYDGNGNLTSKTSPAPNQTGSATVTLSYCYDALNRLTSKAYTAQSCPMSAPIVTYSYDQTSFNGLTIANGIGRRTGMTDQAGSEAWSYDSMGRIAADQRTTNNLTRAFSYTYNLDGSLATATHPKISADGPLTVTFHPGGAGRPIAEDSVDAGYAYNVHYAPNGALCYWKQNWAAITTANRTFNNRFQPVRIYESDDYNFTPPTPCTAPTQNSNLPVDFTYSYTDANGHNNGNVAQITYSDFHRTQLYSYDSLNRIATARTSETNQPAYQGDNPLAACWGEQFGYDPWGNLLSIGSFSSAYTGCTQENLSVAVNTRNQIIGNTYDAAGNLILAQPGDVQYVYDAENHLTSAGGQTYLYDGDGKRVEKASGSPLTANQLYWYGADDSPEIETDPAGNELYRYFRFQGLLVTREEANDFVDHYGLDALGNVRWLYSHNGAWDVIDYYPFGGTRILQSSGDNNTRMFTSKERDSESGLDHFHFRNFASTMGRWMSPDPINLTAKRLVNPANTLNKYIYGGNNPLLYTDPTGQDITVFYRAPGGGGQDFGHILLAVTNQATGAVRFADYYPKGNKPGFGPAPGEMNQNETADRLKQHAALTIQTSPELAQKLIDAIDAISPPNGAPDYWLPTSSCVNICTDLLNLAGIDPPSPFATPTDVWSYLYGNYSAEALQGGQLKMGLSRYQAGKDFGNSMSVFPKGTDPFYNLQLLYLLANQQRQKPPGACTTIQGPNGPETNCVD